jgi:hypothetical protein
MTFKNRNHALWITFINDDYDDYDDDDDDDDNDNDGYYHYHYHRHHHHHPRYLLYAGYLHLYS